MKSIAFALLALFAIGSAVGVSTGAQKVVSASNDLSCTIGPLNKTYGKTHWLVYGCNDGRSVVVTTAPGSPAMPFYFFFVFGSDGMELHGEGTGNKQATDAAYEELKLLTAADVAALYQQAKAAANQSSG